MTFDSDNRLIQNEPLKYALHVNIAANPPEFFLIIRKSKLECKFPNDECFQIMKILFFGVFSPPSSVDDRTSACHNQHARVLWFCGTAHALQATIHFLFLYMCAIFFSFRGHAPLPNPSPLGITISAGWQLCMYSLLIIALTHILSTHKHSVQLHSSTQALSQEQKVWQYRCKINTKCTVWQKGNKAVPSKNKQSESDTEKKVSKLLGEKKNAFTKPH